jgi:hypothetical protein
VVLHKRHPTQKTVYEKKLVSAIGREQKNNGPHTPQKMNEIHPLSLFIDTSTGSTQTDTVTVIAYSFISSTEEGTIQQSTERMEQLTQLIEQPTEVMISQPSERMMVGTPTDTTSTKVQQKKQTKGGRRKGSGRKAD